MRKLLMLIAVSFVTINTLNAALNKSKAQDKEAYNTSSAVFESNVAELFTNLSRKEYEQLTGRHLSLLERVALKFYQKKLKRKYDEQNPSKGFNLTGFLTGLGSGIVGALFGALILSIGILSFLVLGLLFSFVGVSFTSIFSKDENLRKWALRGLGTYVVLALIFIIVEIIALIFCHCLG